MSEQASITVALNADSAGFTSNVEKGGQSLKGLRDEVTKSKGALRDLRDALGSRSTFGLAVKTLAGAGAVAGIGLAVNQVAEFGQKLGDLAGAEQTGAKFAGEIREEFLRSIPIVGRLVDAVSGFGEMLSGGRSAKRLFDLHAEARSFDLQQGTDFLSAQTAASGKTGIDLTIAQRELQLKKELQDLRKEQEADPSNSSRSVQFDYDDRRQALMKAARQDEQSAQYRAMLEEGAATRQHEATLTDIAREGRIRRLTLAGQTDKAELVAIGQQYDQKIRAVKEGAEKALLAEGNQERRQRIRDRAAKEVNALRGDKDDAIDAAQENQRRAQEQAASAAAAHDIEQYRALAKQKEDIDAEVSDRQMRRNGSSREADRAKVVRELKDMRLQVMDAMDFNPFDPSGAAQTLSTLNSIDQLQASRLKDLDAVQPTLPTAIQRRFDLTAVSSEAMDPQLKQLDKLEAVRQQISDLNKALSKIADNAIAVVGI
jgi:hypothetical protein